MKVAYISRSTLFSGQGGDTIQILKTAEYLRKKGVHVDVFTTDDPIDYAQYDIMHGFNVIRPADLIKHFRAFRGIKALSTIFVDYHEYERYARQGLSGTLFRTIGSDRTEYLKASARWIKNGEKNFSWRYLLQGHKRSVREILHLSDVLLPNSASEYQRLVHKYGIEKKHVVIPNGIDPAVFAMHETLPEKQSNVVICVARIDGIKNQLNLIRALNNTEFNLVLIGKPAPNHTAYYEQCRREAQHNVQFIPHLDQQELVKYYRDAKVHAMPSWFETTGLSSLEAAAMGCSVVVSPKGDTHDYFSGHAFFCNPANSEDIYKAVKQAAAAAPDEVFRKKIYSHYTWDIAAEKTWLVYQSLITRA